jgi:GNAT superfamily N-acetyltransferase
MATYEAHASADARVAAYWASFLGCTPQQLKASGMRVVPHAGLKDYRGVYLFRRNESCIVSVPATLLSSATSQWNGQDAATSFDITRLRRFFGDAIERIVGPAWQGFTWAGAFRPAEQEGVHLLTAEDAPALQRLADACGEQAWQHSGIGGADQMVFGVYRGDMIVGAGMGEPRAATLLHIGIITHPDYRGRGYGRAVVSSITAHGLEIGLVPWYQTLAANTPSVAIARALSFSQYAETLAVRLSRLNI